MPPKQIRKIEKKPSGRIDTDDWEAKDSENVNEKDAVEDNLDIGKLVDECFGGESNNIDILENDKYYPGNKSWSLESEKGLVSKLTNSPALALTLEEDFRIHELIVRKENLFCGFYNVFLEYPNFVVLWKRFLHQIKNSCPVIQSGVPADSYDCNMKYVVRENFVKGGKFTLLCFDIAFPFSRRFGEACAGDV